MRRTSKDDSKTPKDKGDPRGSREQTNTRGGTGKELPEKGDKNRKRPK